MNNLTTSMVAMIHMQIDTITLNPTREIMHRAVTVIHNDSRHPLHTYLVIEDLELSLEQLLMNIIQVYKICT